MSMTRFGTRITLTDGSTPILEDFSPSAGAFVKHDHLVERQVGDGTRIGPGYRVWVKAPGFRLARDRDGTKIGIVYQPDVQAQGASHD